MTKDEFIQAVRMRAFKAGGQGKFAAAHGMHPNHFSAVVHGHRGFTDEQLLSMGYRAETVYLPLD